MFIDKRYECVTVPEVRREFVQAKKFKTKYPWRDRYVSKIKSLPVSKLLTDDFQQNSKMIDSIHNKGIVNEKTGKDFNLSPVDRLLISYAITHEFILSSIDNDLVRFAEQEFDKANISPLGIINDWLEKSLLEWTDEMQAVIEDWLRCNEHSQSQKDIQRFSKLTGRKYVGP